MNYEKLFKDKTEGKISDKMTIVFDNDGGYWGCDDENDEVTLKMIGEYERRYGRPGGYSDLVDIMTAAGFKAEWC